MILFFIVSIYSTTLKSSSNTDKFQGQKVLSVDNYQTVYVFQKDANKLSCCYKEQSCQQKWPPVYLVGEIIYQNDVDKQKYALINRTNQTKQQITYNGWPLYTYDEGAGQIKCHDINANGGYWWAISTNGTVIKTSKNVNQTLSSATTCSSSSGLLKFLGILIIGHLLQ